MTTQNTSSMQSSKLWMKGAALLLAFAGMWPLFAGDSLAIDLWSAPGLILDALLGVSLAAAAVAWRSEGIGGMLLGMSGLALGLVACMAMGQVQLTILLGVGAPQMIAGGLFMVCWFMREEEPNAGAELRRPYPASVHTSLTSLFKP